MTLYQELHAVLKRFDGVRVGVMGDLMVDRFIYGAASRISPEAPVPVVHIRERTTQPGGAANVGHNVLSLSGNLALYGVLGDDEPGREVRGMLEDQGADLRGVLHLPGRPSTVKTRVVAHAQHLVRFDEEETNQFNGDVAARLLGELDAQLGSLDIMVLSDYAKGLFSRELAQDVIHRCRERGVTVIVDPKPVNWDSFAGADIIKPNLGEALRLVGLERQAGDGEMEGVCRGIRDRVSCQAVVVTAGAKGMYILEDDTMTHLPGKPREVYDVAGAGDTTLAAIALTLGAGSDLTTAARLGNLAGSIAVGKLGVAAVTLDELHAEVDGAYGAA